MGTTDPALIRARQQLADLQAGTSDVLLGLVGVVADLTAVVATLMPTDAQDTGDTGGDTTTEGT